MEKQFSRLCSSLLALTFLEVKEIYSVVNGDFFCLTEKIPFWTEKTQILRESNLGKKSDMA